MVLTTTSARETSQKSSTADSNTNSLKSVAYFSLLVCSNTSMHRFKYTRLSLLAYVSYVFCLASCQISSGIMAVWPRLSSFRKKYLVSAMFQNLNPSNDCISFAFMPLRLNKANMITASSFVWVSKQVVPPSLRCTNSSATGW